MTDLGLARGWSAVAAVVDGPLTMLFLSASGMAIGLAIDCGSLPPDVLASLCLGRTASLGAGIVAHLSLLPATHAMMLAGALISAGISEASAHEPRLGRERSIPAMIGRYLPGAVSAAAMLAGMIIGGFLGPPLIERFGASSGFARLTIAMVLGMAAGMIVVTPLCRFGSRPAKMPGRCR